MKSYKRLLDAIDNGRMAGYIDWNHIEDRTRNLERVPHWDNPGQILDICARQFRLDKWLNQPVHIEVWGEKDALSGVVESACRPLDVPYLACRGFASQSEMWRAAMRLVEACRRTYAMTDGTERSRRAVILHLGDHDPSGIDMTRDNRERLALFCEHHGVRPPTVKRLALNMDQVETYNPPPNPAKSSDSRYADYAEKFGDESWELDALDPQVIVNLITANVLAYRNEAIWEVDSVREATYRTLLGDLSDTWASRRVQRAIGIEVGRDARDTDDDTDDDEN